MISKRIAIKEGIFTDEAQRSSLLANKCSKCGQIFFPKSSLCLSCFSDSLNDLKLSRIGKLYSFTVGSIPSQRFSAPYAVGYIDMPEGVRLFAPLIIIENKPFKIGMDMEVTIETLWSEGDTEITGYKFKPI